MSESEFNISKGRGGCLDKFVQISTLGTFGVETEIRERKKKIIPTNPVVNENGELMVEQYKGQYESASEYSIRTGKVLIVQDYRVLNEPLVSRRIVRNK